MQWGHVAAKWHLLYLGLKILGRRQVGALLWRGTEAVCSATSPCSLEAVEENASLVPSLPNQEGLAQVICLDS